MDRTWLFLLMGFLAGAVAPVQAGVNAQLRQFSGHAVWTALASFTIGTLTLLAYFLVARLPWPETASLGRAPWWAWLGGLLGAYYVLSAVVVAPRLGAAVLVALIIAGQLIVALGLDHFGLVGYPQHPVNLARVVGALFLLIGVVLIQRY
jgi:transporter family-2 protein